MNIVLKLTDKPKTKPSDESKLGFGAFFSDHMLIRKWTLENGWEDAEIVPYENFSLSPAAAVFHYGAEIFEGLKAYRTADGHVQLFRPIENVRRMNNSAERLCMPEMDEQEMLECITKFVEVEKDWVPHSEGTSLYLRPFLIGTDPKLGVHTVHQCTFCIIGSPSGSYYAEGINPVRIMIETEDVRAVRGGTGYAKCGGNYGASYRAGHKAELQGYSQVLWLDGVERKYIEEVGAMNVMFKIDGVIVTPELLGSVLPGITRKSCIELLKSKGYKVEERRISADELFTALKEGRLEEAWGTGTAAVVSPIGELSYKGEKYEINNFKIGETTQMLYDTLTSIQWGKAEDKFNWITKVC